MHFLDIDNPIYAAALLGQSAYTEGIPDDPYADDCMLELIAWAEDEDIDTKDLIATWRANWANVQKKIVRH